MMAPFFSINTAWRNFQKRKTSFRLVLNRKFMQFIMFLEWKKLYMVQELWSDTFHLTARILMQRREVTPGQRLYSRKWRCLPLLPSAPCVYLACFYSNLLRENCEGISETLVMSNWFDWSNNFEPFRYMHRCFLCGILKRGVTKSSLSLLMTS